MVTHFDEWERLRAEIRAALNRNEHLSSEGAKRIEQLQALAEQARQGIQKVSMEMQSQERLGFRIPDH
ncbi:hypothetical protein OC844_002779 [Tilletia horrida]|nr:hypothetical protein OC844_002779 [Tilletia horrida]